MKYIIRHFVKMEFITEDIVDGDKIDAKNNNLKEYSKPTVNAKYNLIKGSEKIIRTTYEEYDEKFINSIKESASNK